MVRWKAWTFIFVVFFGAIAPTLTWLEFSGGMENLNLATAVELRRDHPDSWIIPTLEGEARIKKPALPAWITAWSISPDTIAQMSAKTEAAREAAMLRLAWQSRWPALLAACIMLIGVYELGLVLVNWRVGLMAAFMCGSTVMFLRFSRSAMTDIYLGMFVTIANVLLARAIFLRQHWVGFCGAGLCIGAALMCKGPVAWAMTLLPVALFGIWNGLRGGRWQGGLRAVVPMVVGIVLMLAVALPWPMKVMQTLGGGIEVWKKDISRADTEKSDKPIVYLGFIAWMMPWSIVFVGGLLIAKRRMLLAALLSLSPFIALLMVDDRKDRYCYPMIAGASVVAAYGMLDWLDRRRQWKRIDNLGWFVQSLVLLVFGVIAPIIFAMHWPRMPGFVIPWGLAIPCAVVSFAAIFVGYFSLRQPAAICVAGVLVMLMMQAVFMRAYRNTTNGKSDMRPLARAIVNEYPDVMTWQAHPKGKRASVDFSIYMNRVTRWIAVDKVETLKPAARPQIVLLHQDPTETEPVAPAGWRFFRKTLRDDTWWWAYVLDAQK